MVYWEFLLQKEGDRSWLPLESPDVEILEGRYRVVARSNRVNTPVEVRILHQTDEESGSQPKHRSQKRASKTNQDGLIVVLPFTWLQPGLWELRCASDVMADMMGQAWKHTVQLHVQPQESGLGDEWIHELERELNAESPLAAETPSPTAPALTVSELSDASTAAETDTAPVSTADAPDTPDLAPDTAPAEVAVLVYMDQDSYTARQQHPLVLTGKFVPVRSPDQPDHDAADADTESVPVPSGYIHAIQVRLLNPQTGEACLEQVIPVQVSALPFAFTCHLDSPSAVDTHLLIGQLAVLGQDHQLLAQQSFTVATDLEVLLKAIADESIFEGLSDLGELQSPFALAEPPDLSLLNLVSADQETVDQPETAFQVTNTEPIPPQLYQPDVGDEAVPRKPLDLPSFDNATPDQDVNAAAQADQFGEAALAASDTPASANLDHLDDLEGEAAFAFAAVDDAVTAAIPPEADLETASLQASHIQSEEILATPTISVPGASNPIMPAEVASDWMPSPLMPSEVPQTIPLSPTDREFQALNLQTRFLQRLSELASDTELHDWLRSQYDSSGNNSTAAANGHNGSQPSSLHPSEFPSDLSDRFSSREFVIDDEEAFNPTSDASGSLQSAIPETMIPEPLKMPDDEPIPSPQLTLRSQELISGQPLQIVVTLPNVRPRFSVKLWLQDPQTRELLDGPYWLTTFGPNGHDQLESGLQVIVPFGCLEVQFEAIAVEVATQRESRKTTVHRAVIPPDLSTSPADDLRL